MPAVGGMASIFSSLTFSTMIVAMVLMMPVYIEYYGALSLSKMTGKNFSTSVVKDISLIGEINYARGAEVKKYLPGIRWS